MKRFKFVNAELQNNEIFNTEQAVHGENNSETSFDKLPAYNSRLSLVDGKNKFMIFILLFYNLNNIFNKFFCANSFKN